MIEGRAIRERVRRLFQNLVMRNAIRASPPPVASSAIPSREGERESEIPLFTSVISYNGSPTPVLLSLRLRGLIRIYLEG